MATALYRRYRPETFADVIGQDHVTVPLMRALRNGRIGHAYLFSGPRGCGKTTSARILARCLNCAEGPTETPCGRCDSCRDLARGGPGSLDVVEIDAASHGGVDDARELRERATFAPARDRYKVFIIDEAHMVTSAGFNALLKLVEEPPEHVKFVFATTEPEKVIGTIRSRTHHYPFRLIPPQVLGPYLEQVCHAEGVEVGEGVLPLVVRAGAGSARDTLSVLDQLMAGAGDHGLDHATAIALLGFTDSELLDRTITAIGARDAAGMYGAVEQVIASGQEPRRFVEDVLERLRDLIVLGAVPDRGEDLLPQLPADELARMRQEVEGFEVADLSRCGDLVHETLSTMSGATSPRLHLELLAARLVLRDERAAYAPAGAAGEEETRRGAPARRTDGAAAPGGDGGAGVSGRDRVRQIAEQQAAASRRTREEDRGPEQDRTRTDAAPRQRTAGPQGEGRRATRDAPRPDDARGTDPREGASRPADGQGSRPRQGTPAPAPSAVPPAGRSASSAGGIPTPADDDWGPVAPIGRDRPAEQHETQPTEHPVDDDRAAPMHGGVRPSRPGEAPRDEGPRPEDAAPDRPAPSEGGLDVAEVRDRWDAVLGELQQIRRPAWALISQNAHVHATQGTTLVLGFPTEGLLAAFGRGTTAENLADALRRVLGRDVALDAVVGEDPAPGGAGGGGGRPGGGDGPSADGGRGDGGRGAEGGRDGGPGTDDRRGGGRGGRDGRGGRGTDDGRGPDGRPPAPNGARAETESRPAQARSAGRTAAVPPMPEEDFPPEPDDPYPPDPYDEGGHGDPYARQEGSASPREVHDPADAEPTTASGRDGSGVERAERSVSGEGSEATNPERPSGSASADAPADAPEAPDDSHEDRRSTAPDPVSPATPRDLSPLIIPDDSRDDLADDVPRTHGQEALRRAIAEGRPVRTEPRHGPVGHARAAGDSAHTTSPSAAASSPDDRDTLRGGAATAASATGTGSATGTDSATGIDAATGRYPATGPDSETTTNSVPPPADDDWPPLAVNGHGPRTDRDAEASVGRTPGRAGHGEAPRRGAAADDQAGGSRRPQGGAALVREAALASRHAPQRHGGAPRGETAPRDPEDPTGGASRDDQDAVVATRRPQELVTELLGGTVLEVIDESH